MKLENSIHVASLTPIFSLGTNKKIASDHIYYLRCETEPLHSKLILNAAPSKPSLYEIKSNFKMRQMCNPRFYKSLGSVSKNGKGVISSQHSLREWRRSMALRMIKSTSTHVPLLLEYSKSVHKSSLSEATYRTGVSRMRLMRLFETFDSRRSFASNSQVHKNLSFSKQLLHAPTSL